MDAKTPLEKLQFFLEMEDDEISCMSLQDMREEVQRLGIDPERLTSNLKKRVSEAAEQAGVKELPAYASRKSLSGTGSEQGLVLGIKRTLQVSVQYFSKTDRSLITHCSNLAVMSQTSLGVLVFISGVIAFLSGAYAIYMAFHSIPIAVFVGGLYGVIMVFIDRELVSSSSKSAALLRLPLAILVGFIISVPLELRLFESSITQQLKVSAVEESRVALERRLQAENTYQTKIDVLERDIREYRKGIVESQMAMQDEITGTVKSGRARTGRAGRGPFYAEAMMLISRYEDLMRKSEDQLAELKMSKDKELERIDHENATRPVPAAYDLLARYEALERIKSTFPMALYMIWGIRLFLISIQAFPILVKLVVPQNDYYAVLEAERRKAIARVNAIANEQLGQIMDNPYSTPLPIISASLSTLKGQVDRSPRTAEPALT